MNPMYKHDSDCCKFVKVDKDDFGTMCDMYVCNNVIIFRYSDEPSDNRAISMKTVDAFPESYQDILSDKDLMTEYNKVNGNL